MNVKPVKSLRNNRLMLFSLFTASINILPLLVVPFLLALLQSFSYVIVKHKVKYFRGLSGWLMLYIFLSLLYCFVIGVNLLELGLYRRELKYIIPMGGFILFSSMNYTGYMGKRLYSTFNYLLLLSYIFLCFSPLLVLGDMNLTSLYPLTDSPWEKLSDGFIYSGQFITHSAAGGFFSILAMLLLGFYQVRNNKLSRPALKNMMGILLALVLLFLSRSRAYELSVGIIILYVLVSRVKVLKNIYFILLSLSALIAAVVIINNIYIYRQSNLSNVSATLNTREYNIVTRYILWGDAIEDFINSPLVGVGISRFDDSQNVLNTIPGNDRVVLNSRFLEGELFRINVSSSSFHTDQHAHNIYLHILAEGGLVFFTLFVILMYKMRGLLLSYENIAPIEERGLVEGVKLSFICVLLASFFGNNIFAIIPTYMLMVLSGYIQSQRYKILNYGAML